MTEYLYRVVSRSPGGEWEPEDTSKRLYFKVGTARGVKSMKQRDHESSENQRRRYVENYGSQNEKFARLYAPNPREFAVARVPVGSWEVMTDDA